MSVPSGWIAAGRTPRDYQFSVEQTARGTCAVIRARKKRPADFGTLMQEFRADDYRGKRVRLSASIEREHFEGKCALWLRVDGDERRVLAFESRPIESNEWTRYQVVLDVGEAATQIAFGVLLDGSGAARLGEVAFDTVSADVPLTAPRGPRNLAFEE
jgi:hypothetical protein